MTDLFKFQLIRHNHIPVKFSCCSLLSLVYQDVLNKNKQNKNNNNSNYITRTVTVCTETMEIFHQKKKNSEYKSTEYKNNINYNCYIFFSNYYQWFIDLLYGDLAINFASQSLQSFICSQLMRLRLTWKYHNQSKKKLTWQACISLCGIVSLQVLWTPTMVSECSLTSFTVGDRATPTQFAVSFASEL